MDALALLCNLHGDGPETLRRLRVAGVLDLSEVSEMPRAQLDRLLERGSLAAERFRREGRLLEKRLGGESAYTERDASAQRAGATSAAVGSQSKSPSRSESSAVESPKLRAHDLQDWVDARESGDPAQESKGSPQVAEAPDRMHGQLGGQVAPLEPELRGERASRADESGASPLTGGLVHPFPARKRPSKPRGGAEPQRLSTADDAPGDSVLSSFLERWRDDGNPSSPSRGEVAAKTTGVDGEVASEVAQHENAQQEDARGKVAGPEHAGQEVAALADTIDGVADRAESSLEAGSTPSAIRQLADWARRARDARDPIPPAETEQVSKPAKAPAGAVEAVIDAPSKASKASRLLDQWASAAQSTAAQSAAPRTTAPRTTAAPNTAAQNTAAQNTAPNNTAPEPATPPSARVAPRSFAGASDVSPAVPASVGTPLGRLPGGERCGPSLEALAYAGVTCLEDLSASTARKLAGTSGLPYTEVLRLQFLAERFLARS